MVKKIVVVAILLAVGVGIALQLHSRRTADVAEAFTPQTGASTEVRIADLERALAAQIDRSRALEARVRELETLRGAQAAAGDGQGQAQWRGGAPDEGRIAELRGLMGDDGRPDPAAMRERARERQQQRLVEAGFTPERAAWIERRTQELELQAMQARYDAQRNGRPGQDQIDVQGALRNEMGDAEYERYLTATGRPTEVRVMDVLASSAAEKSGLQAGDQIVSYAGTRVYDMRELEALTRQGSPGESVAIEVRRNGQTVQVQVPRGVLGVSGGNTRGGPPGGGPGGFRRP